MAGLLIFSGGTIPHADAHLTRTPQDLVDDKGIVSDSVRISILELHRLWQRNVPVVLLDVRSEWTYETSTLQARGAVRLSPDRAAAEAEKIGLPHPAWLVAYRA